MRDQRTPDQPESAKHDDLVIVDELVIQLIRRQLRQVGCVSP